MKITRSQDEVDRCFLGSEAFLFERTLCGSVACLTCSENLTCFTCKDSTATIVNGSCVCSAGLSFDLFGHCSECTVEHCETCDPLSNDICETCKPGFLYSTLTGKCECENQGEKVNIEGNCEACVVEGCSFCEIGNPNRCQKCEDCSSYLEDGQCLCPFYHEFNSTSLTCQTTLIGEALGNEGCDILGCEQCEVNNPNVCSYCLDYWADVNDEGICECWFSTEELNSEGICAYCWAQGCSSCIAGSSLNCYRCTDQINTEIIEGDCFCV